MIFKIMTVAAATAIGIAISYFVPGSKDDNPVEEACEKVIKNQTGLDIDLTPNSPEHTDMTTTTTTK